MLLPKIAARGDPVACELKVFIGLGAKMVIFESGLSVLELELSKANSVVAPKLWALSLWSLMFSRFEMTVGCRKGPAGLPPWNMVKLCRGGLMDM